MYAKLYKYNILNTSKKMYADESKIYYKEHNPNNGNSENSKDILKNSSENDIEKETIFLFN